jgi:gliding motility-associated-like protein
MRMKKTFTKLLLFCLLLLGSVTHARADHMVGSDVSWKCLGGDTFIITIADYRDCNGIPFVNTPFVLTPINCPGFSAQTVGGKGSGGKDITPVCKKSCTRCTDAQCDFPFGIQQYFITATVILKKGCCDYKISWEQCCRSAGITTGATWKDYYIESTLSACTHGCDNSPYFANPPVAIYCTNQCVVYNPGANDDDRDVNGEPDSLAYSLVDPLTGPGSSVPWTGSYSSQEPLDYSGFPGNPDGTFEPPKICDGFHVDPITGEIKFKAVKTDVTVIALNVAEYRKDSLGIYRKIGEIRRDMQILIIDCPDNHAPVVTGINGSTITSAVFCAEQQNCFKIKCFDQDPKDSVTMSWNNQIPAASFYIQDKTKKWPTGVFCWRPNKADIRIAPYRFVVTAVDNACPVPGRTTKTFAITVIAPPEATYSAVRKSCGLVEFSAYPAGSSSITGYVWSGDGAPGYGPLFSQSQKTTYQYTRGGVYHYTLTVQNSRGCKTSYTDSLKIDPFVYISLPPDTNICQNSAPLTIPATFGLGNKPYGFSWNTGDKGVTSITRKITKDTVFVAYIKDANGCTNYDSMKVKFKKLPKPNLGPDQRGCWGHDLRITTGLKHMPSVFWTKIKGTDTLKKYARGDTLFVNDSGMYISSVRDSFGCPGTDSVNIYYNPLVKARSSDTDVCVNDSVTINGGLGGIDATFLWYNRSHPNSILSTDRNYKFKAINTAPGGTPYLVIVTQTRHGVSCVDSGIFNVFVHKKPVPILVKLPDKCIDDNAFLLDRFVDAAHSGGTWFYPPKPEAIVSNYLYPYIMGTTVNDPASGYVHYIYTDPYRCSTIDSERILISTLPQVTAGHDTEICTARGRYILSNSYVSPSGGQWVAAAGTPKDAIQYSSFRDTVFFDPSKVPVDSVYDVIYQITKAEGKANCSNSDTVHIRVKTNPTIVVSPVDTLCDTGNPWSLVVTPATGQWTFLDATDPNALTYDAGSNVYIFDPHIAGGGNHKILYTAYGDVQRKLCATLDSITVAVVAAPKASFRTEDTMREYCFSHAPVRLIPNQNWPGGQFSGQGNQVSSSGGVYYFHPSFADTTDSNKNVVSYIVPYDGRKCQLIISKKIAVDARPSAHINTDSSQCEGLITVVLTAEANNVTHWAWTSAGGNLIPPGTKTGNIITTTYTPTLLQLKVRGFGIDLKTWNDGKCNAATDHRDITINSAPKPHFTADSLGCEPFRTTFASTYDLLSNGSIISRYDWDFGDGAAHSAEKDPTHIYKVTNDSASQHFKVILKLTTNHHCEGVITKTSFITVNATPRPKILANPQFTTVAIPKVHFDVDPVRSQAINFKDPNIAYSWNFGEPSTVNTSKMRSPDHTYGDSGIYKVLLSVKSNECTGSDSILINIRPELIIYIPNVFKPNEKHGRGHGPGDNFFGPTENETFQPFINSFTTFDMNVYNRWGELMYNTTDPKKGWDGKYQGGDSQEGVYVYVIKATSFSGRPYTFTGSVTLIR